MFKKVQITKNSISGMMLGIQGKMSGQAVKETEPELKKEENSDHSWIQYAPCC